MAKKKINKYFKSNKYSLGGMADITNMLKIPTSGPQGTALNFGQTLSLGSFGGIANTAASTVSGLINPSGNSTTVGNIMQGVGSIASNIPGIGGIIGAGVNMLGGIVNAAFGSNLNEEFIAQTEDSAKKQAGYVSKATDNSSLLSDWSSHTDLAHVSQDDVGSDGWFSDKAKDETARLNREIDKANLKAWKSLGNTASNIDTNNDLLALANYAANGGNLIRKHSTGLFQFPHKFGDGGPLNPYSAESLVNAIYDSSIREEFLGKPSHNYDFTISEEEANRLGYYPDKRGHRDDRVKKPTHPTHTSRGKWNSFEEFELTDKGMENPNYTLFGLNDGGQDPQAIMTYKGGIVLPEITITPKESYIMNPYDNIKIFDKGGSLINKNSSSRKFNNSYKEGEIYDVTEEEVKILKELGYEFEYV